MPKGKPMGLLKQLFTGSLLLILTPTRKCQSTEGNAKPSKC